MFSFRFALNRYLYGIFTKGLARFFDATNSVSVTLASGGRFKIYLNDTYWCRFALFHAEYEPEIARILEICAGRADTFCDAGANKGYWSVYAAPLYRRVVAIEASSKTFKSLTENTRHVSNVSRHWAAVFRASNLELSFKNVVGSHVSSHLARNPDHNATSEQVETVALDDLLEPGKAAVIKLDVEGGEEDAIAGSRRSLADGSVLLYEDHGSDKSSAASAKLLKLGNVSVYSLEGAPKRMASLEAIQRTKRDRYKGYNFLAAQDNSALLKHILDAFAQK